ncbi:MAG: FtsQ-type POTRA domain-containing protein [Acidobacteria bacterium]|nr:FtsQ-type POTRA domain-containing protein [Acidobacteriota bacterium]
MTPRANGRGALAGRKQGIVQKPARRGARERAGGSKLRAALAYAPLAGKFLLAIVAGVLLFAGYRAAASASFFEARSIDISGASRASADEIKAVVRRSVAGKGVWQANLSDISAELERLPWVRKAVVSRVLPDGLRVRVTERVERAVVHTNAGRFIWVDEDAVTLGQMSPTDQMPPFFIRGWDEGGTKEAQAENRERVEKYLEMSREWGSLGLSERVSEVDLTDLHDVRALLAGEDAQIEVRLGEKNYGSRLQKALKVLDEQRSTALGPFITYLVANQDAKGITVGHSATAPTVKEDNGGDGSADNEAAKANERAASTQPASRNRNTDERAASKKAGETQKKKETKQKEKASSEAKKETRPRRVR